MHVIVTIETVKPLSLSLFMCLRLGDLDTKIIIIIIKIK